MYEIFNNMENEMNSFFDAADDLINKYKDNKTSLVNEEKSQFIIDEKKEEKDEI